MIRSLPFQTDGEALGGSPAVRFALIMAAAGALVALFMRIMGENLRHDEHLFITAGALFGEKTLYLDISYTHLPNLPMLFAAVFALTGTDHYLLVGRILVFLIWIGLLVGIYLLGARLAQSRTAGLFAALMLLTNSLMISHVGMVVSNNLFAAVFMLYGFYVFITAMDGITVMGDPEPKSALVALSGLLLALAAGFKANFAVFIPAFVVAVCLLPRASTFTARLRSAVLPLAIGGVLGALPTLYFAAVHFEDTLFNVFGFFVGPHKAYWSDPANAATVTGLTLPSRVLFGYMLWSGGTIVLVVVAIVYCLCADLAASGREAWHRWRPSWQLVLTAALLLLGIAICFAVAPSFPQYFLPPIPIAIALAACFYGRLASSQRDAARPVLAALAIVAALIAGPRLIVDLPKLARPDLWTAFKVHAVADDIGNAVRNAGLDGPLATLTPIYALEAGLEISAELAGGPFFYRIGDYLPASERARYRLPAPSNIADIFDKSPPAAILVGFEGTLDDPLADYAETRGYTLLERAFGEDRYGIGRLYLAPAATR